ncbi:MAG: FeS assembly ATPase SufC, partial [Candidatus Woesebacteria bacterium GW2011_GWA1_37_7]
KEKDEMSVLLITHYSRILKNIGVDKISVMKRGAIVQDGGRDLAEELEEHGYSN